MTPEQLAALEAKPEPQPIATPEALEGAPAAEAKQAEVQETPPAAGEEAAQTPEPVSEKEVPASVQERINKAIRKQRDAERDAQYWREQAQKVPSPATEPVQPSTVKPKVESFSTYEEWVEAVADWKLGERDRQTKTGAVKQQEAKARESFDARIEKGREKYHDFDEVAYIPQGLVPLLAELEDVDIGDLAHHWGQHQEEASRVLALAQTQPARAVYQIVQTMARLGAVPPRKTVTSAPAPISPVGAPTTVEKDEDKIPIRDWMKRQRAEMAGGRR